MAKEGSSCLWIFIIIIVVIGGYLGFIKLKKDATLSGVATGNDLEVTARCMDKKIDGRYSLSIVTTKATYKPWEKQELEYRYEFNLIKDGCAVSGEDAKRLGSTTLDTTTTLTSDRNPLNINDATKVNIEGEIEPDTIILNIRVNTDNPQDCKLSVKFPFQKEGIKILDGIFIGKNCGLLYGTAKLTKK